MKVENEIHSLNLGMCRPLTCCQASRRFQCICIVNIQCERDHCTVWRCGGAIRESAEGRRIPRLVLNCQEAALKG